LTKIQIFTESNNPYQINRVTQGACLDISDMHKSSIGNKPVEKNKDMTISDALHTKSILAEFLVDVCSGAVTPLPWIDYAYKRIKQHPAANEDFYKELFPEREEEILMCEKWLSANVKCDDFILKLYTK